MVIYMIKNLSRINTSLYNSLQGDLRGFKFK